MGMKAYRAILSPSLLPFLLHLLLLLLLLLPLPSLAYEVVYAVNCGGSRHTDRFGIKYSSDSNPVGIPSDFGRGLIIGRVHQDDMVLYQTERYHSSSFSYSAPLAEDGEYLLILKFAEVYFTSPGQKVFDIQLNGMTVIKDLDIYSRVGKAAAHDEVIQFKVQDGTLSVTQGTTDFHGKLSIEFVKGPADNPKVNAIVVAKGPFLANDIPALPPPQVPEAEDSDADMESEWMEQEKRHKFTKTSGPKVQNPYVSDDSWFMPITVAIAVFLPVLFCLCRVR